MKLRTITALLAVLVTSPVIAQSTAFTVLIPVTAPYATPGAYGSTWQTELWIYNGTPSALFALRDQCVVPPCTGRIPAGQTTQYPPNSLTSAAGALMIVFPSEMRHQLAFSSRLFELSKHAQPAGVEIPVVFSDEFFSTPVRFVSIDGTPTKRVALRVYHPVHSGSGVVRIDIFRPDGTLLLSSLLPIAYFVDRDIWAPGSAAIADMARTFPELQGVDRYDIVVTPVTPAGMQFYALVSVTDLDTQQVLMVTAKP